MIDITVDSNVFHGFLFYTGVLVLKTMLMSLLTTRMRFMKRVWSSPEDIDAAIKLKIPSPSLKYDDEHVERVRRAHLNDLENIPMFVFSGFVYTLTQPNPSVALILFRIYTLTRILHTLVYAVYVVPQPARAIFHIISYFIALYMTIIVAKVLVMALLTALQRLQKKVLPAEEDTKFFSFILKKKMEVIRDDPDVERVRRAHLNDLENIPQFIFAGSIYILTQPNEFLAINLFRTYTVFRVLHTLVYAVIPIPQPARVICFGIPFAITYFMLLMNVLTFFKI